jgi:hypothetical protein
MQRRIQNTSAFFWSKRLAGFRNSLTTDLNLIYCCTVAICITYWTGQISNWQLLHNRVVRSKQFNVVHNLHRYVGIFHVSSKQLISQLYRLPHMLLHTKPYSSKVICLEYI